MYISTASVAGSIHHCLSLLNTESSTSRKYVVLSCPGRIMAVVLKQNQIIRVLLAC
jgi:hypothetical protein